MNVREALSVPYIRGAESFYDSELRSWRRRFDYGELPGCTVEADTTLDALDALEVARIHHILERAATGAEVPRPRPPLTDLDVELQLKTLGIRLPLHLLHAEVSQVINDPELAGLVDRLADRVAADTSTAGSPPARDGTELNT
jgi:hypothetical protein